MTRAMSGPSPNGGGTGHVLKAPLPPEGRDPRGVDLAAWKQADYRRLETLTEARRADQAFDAEVGDGTPTPVDLAAWKQADYARMKHEEEMTADVPSIGPYPEKESPEVGRGSIQEEPRWKKAVHSITHKVSDFVEAGKGLRDILAVRHLKFRRLESGKISVSADTEPGTRLVYKQSVAEEGFAFEGTRYNPETVAKITNKGLLKGAVSKSSDFADVQFVELRHQSIPR